MEANYSQPQSMQSTTTGEPDYKGIYEIAKTEADIDQFLIQVTNIVQVIKDKKKELKRKGKPLLTYEVAKELYDSVHQNINRITGLTTFKDEKLQTWNYIYGKDMIEWMAKKCMSGLVSDQVWMKAQEMDANGVWEEKYAWLRYGYHRYFTQDQLLAVKEEYDIVSESFGQNIDLKMLWNNVLFFTEAGRNRSLNHLYIEYMKSTYKETAYHHNQDKAKGRMSSFFDRLMNGGGR